MRYLKHLMGLMSFVACLCTACSDNDGPGTKNDQEDVTKACDLADYAAVGDLIYKMCDYIERCDQTIYSLYTNSSYPNGYVDQCHCNTYMNEQLDDIASNLSRKDAYDSFATIGDAWNEGCNDYATGTLRAKLKYFFE